MAKYVDGFLLAVPTNKVDEYRKIARKAGKLWREHGALDYKECVGDDIKVKGTSPFAKAVGAKAGETVIFAYIVYKSRTHRDSVNKKVMKDPRIAAQMSAKAMPQAAPPAASASMAPSVAFQPP